MADTDTGAANEKRKHLMIKIVLFFLAIGGAYTAYWRSYAQFRQTTDDAYVTGMLISIEPQVAGTVVSIGAENTDFVTKGQTLVKLDDTDAATALEKAKAELGVAVRQSKSLSDRVAGARAAVALRETELQKAQGDFDRRKGLYEQKTVTEEVFEHARMALNAAHDALALARHQLREAEGLAEHGDAERHPAVKLAKEKLRDAWFALQRARIAAPASGHVAKRAVQIGERVSPGKPLMAVIPLDRIWVEANFKENQLADMRIGQPVTLHSDMYGSGAAFHGKVIGIGAGTGSVFSVIPAQNATGNWIKVIQRVPVKVSLAPDEIRKNPLLIGLSMKVVVDTHDTTGPAIATAKGERELITTDVYGGDAAGADALIREIVRDNLRREKSGT